MTNQTALRKGVEGQLVCHLALNRQGMLDPAMSMNIEITKIYQGTWNSDVSPQATERNNISLQRMDRSDMNLQDTDKKDMVIILKETGPSNKLGHRTDVKGIS